MRKHDCVVKKFALQQRGFEFSPTSKNLGQVSLSIRGIFYYYVLTKPYRLSAID